jgi:glutaminase
VSSKRLRSEGERALLDRHGDRVRVYDLQGDLVFSVVEAVVRRIVEAGPTLRYAVVDLGRVAEIDDSAVAILAEVLLDFAASDRAVVIVGARQHSRFLRLLEERLVGAERQERLLTFPDLDSALEWCENELLDEVGTAPPRAAAIPLAAHGLCDGLATDEVAALESLLPMETFAPGELIIRRGDAADRLYLLVRGEVSVVVPLPNGRLVRLSTLSAGMTFGELAVVDRTLRSADVRADGVVECFALSMEVFDRLTETHPAIKMRLLENLLRNVSRMLTRLNKAVTTLSQ